MITSTHSNDPTPWAIPERSAPIESQEGGSPRAVEASVFPEGTFVGTSPTIGLGMGGRSLERRAAPGSSPLPELVRISEQGGEAKNYVRGSISNRSAHEAASSRILSKWEDMRKKSGQIWTCLDRVDHSRTGVPEYYVFTLDPECDFKQTAAWHGNFERKREEMHPAVEPDASALLYLDPESSSLEYVRLQKASSRPTESGEDPVMADQKLLAYRYRLQLNRLGFKSFRGEKGDFRFQSPSTPALLAAWNELRTENPRLPSLSIFPSKGVAEDLEFINAFLAHDCLRSDGSERVHDDALHLIPTLLQMLRSSEGKHDYTQTRAAHRSEIEKCLHCIWEVQHLIQEGDPVGNDVKMHLPKMIAALSAAVDVITASSCPELDLFPGFVQDLMASEIWLQPLWQKYWAKKYPEEELDFSLLSTLWNKVCRLPGQIHYNKLTSKAEELSCELNRLILIQDGSSMECLLRITMLHYEICEVNEKLVELGLKNIRTIPMDL